MEEAAALLLAALRARVAVRGGRIEHRDLEALAGPLGLSAEELATLVACLERSGHIASDRGGTLELLPCEPEIPTLTLGVLRCPGGVELAPHRASGGNVVIGRGPDCDWPLPDPEQHVSRRHCLLEHRGGAWLIRDLSLNGTFLNQDAEPIGRERIAPLADGDRIRLGGYEIEVRIEGGAEARPTAALDSACGLPGPPDGSPGTVPPSGADTVPPPWPFDLERLPYSPAMAPPNPASGAWGLDPFGLDPAVPEPDRMASEPVPRTFDRSLLSSAPRATPDAEPVDAAVFCPPRVSKGAAFLVQVFLYEPAWAAAAGDLAREADAAAERRGTHSLPLDVPRGTRVDLRLEMPAFEVAEPDASLAWRGRPVAAQFEVSVPADAGGGEAIGRVRFAVAGVPAGTLRFKIALAAPGAAAGASAGPREAEAVRYRTAFVSYCSEDRAEVLRRVQAFRIAGIDVFQDALDLAPGQRWERELYRAIDRCDVFFLFWSRAAAASEWVAREIEYALGRKAGRDERPPAIQPVPIEGPPPPPPPDALRHLHFNDALLAHIRAAASEPGRPLDPKR